MQMSTATINTPGLSTVFTIVGAAKLTDDIQFLYFILVTLNCILTIITTLTLVKFILNGTKLVLSVTNSSITVGPYSQMWIIAVSQNYSIWVPLFAVLSMEREENGTSRCV